YDVFPGIKAFGCCHEVFHAQEFLCCVLKETKGIETDRTHIYTDASGVNHFTWITSARYKDIDLLSLIPEFAEKFFEEGYSEQGGRFSFREDPFRYGNKVKMDMYLRYGALGAAGDRHLVEFMPGTWYLKDRKTIDDWKIGLTTVDYRENQQAERIAETIEMAEGRKDFSVVKSQEEVVDLMLAIMGEKTVVSNVNMPNMGQAPQLEKGAIVETNCVFSNGHLAPVVSKPLPEAAAALVQRASNNIETCFEGIKERDMEKIFLSFANQPLCASLTMPEMRKLFNEMVKNTEEYLKPYYPSK
ncbi:MAG: alpha-glucosidase/alpha-galactosidase, partial [Clostridia bacterium]|nr:alpha-glucosidase/alpha-galactosidase [Clostridia bacterium]